MSKCCAKTKTKTPFKEHIFPNSQYGKYGGGMKFQSRVNYYLNTLETLCSFLESTNVTDNSPVVSIVLLLFDCAL